jgi:hypothetical protein
MTKQEWIYFWNKREKLTERDWLSCPDPRPMLVFITGKTSDRKIKLFAVAACRLVWGRCDDEFRKQVDVWEQYADGFATEQEMKAAQPYHSWDDPSDAAWAHVAKGDVPWSHLGDKSRTAQLLLLHDILGNPFKPITLNPNWFTPTVKQLAAMIYEERQFNNMPILGDALEEAGCDKEELLRHCRGGGEHVRGCFVLDLVLGKK